MAIASGRAPSACIPGISTIANSRRAGIFSETPVRRVRYSLDGLRTVFHDVYLTVNPSIPHPIRILLVANRGEIAIRVMRAANELGIRTVVIYSQEDRFSLHRTKSDEAYLVGRNKGPIEAYLDIPDILRIAREANVDAIHPGYGFLSENPEFAEACAAAGIVFIGPMPDTMRSLGNKIAARNLATSAGVPVVPATPPPPAAIQECH